MEAKSEVQFESSFPSPPLPAPGQASSPPRPAPSLYILTPILPRGPREKGVAAELEMDPEEGSKRARAADDSTDTVGLTAGWADIPRELLPVVLSRLPCPVDRLRFSVVNKKWHGFIKQHPPRLPPLLPSLVLPASPEHPLVHVTQGGNTRRLGLPPDIKQRASFCGSYEGGWFVLALGEPLENRLFNIFSGVSIPMPTTTMVDGHARYIRVEAAALSGSPVLHPPYNYTIGAIARIEGSEFSGIALWDPSKEHWTCIDWDLIRKQSLDIHDVVYSNGSFYFLNSYENMERIGAHPNREGVPPSLEIYVEKDWEIYDEEHPENMTVQWYLVNLGGMEEDNPFLMVLKYQDEPTQPTSSVRVFRLSEVDEPDGPEYPEDVEPRLHWHELDPSSKSGHEFFLQAKLIFIGRGCSRIFNASDFEDLDDKFRTGVSIFFYDDRGVEDQECFLRGDMGRFTLPEAQVEPWPPVGSQAIGPLSRKFPPTWWIH
ncbi:hypothetical protein ACQJBY_002988 [Aegilops geniculata]